jgi:hypothetical protein
VKLGGAPHQPERILFARPRPDHPLYFCAAETQSLALSGSGSGRLTVPQQLGLRIHLRAHHPLRFSRHLSMAASLGPRQQAVLVPGVQPTVYRPLVHVEPEGYALYLRTIQQFNSIVRRYRA